MSRRATLTIWAACLVGGVVVGVLTDGGMVVRGRPDRADPASEGTNVDAAGWKPRDAGAASGRSASGQEAANADAARDDSEAGSADRSGPPTSGPGRRSPDGSRAGEVDAHDARAARSIIETIVPGIVIPPFDGQPGEPSGSTTTTGPPSTTTTTEAPTTTTSSVPSDPGGAGPIITPLQPARTP